MSKSSINIIYEKFKAGDHITDSELSALIKNHKQISKSLSELNSRSFDLFNKQIIWDLRILEDYQKARKRK